MKINNLNELNTPCLILDKNLLEKNCSKARKKCDEFNTILRPVSYTHLRAHET